ncbi:SPW repeat-containing protein [Tistlia consotensis]|uniref:SPW repeat-containing protein n=1 Tax=Tistlia consotensis USBA 355 TaxID=560819 RepID=A0A1Y6BTZ7_9PROT|nr:SPW repeat protein [Tistlia consotensis]SMF27794.1 SPW repeat-containing protein [Tistlia consotensis USBA 355]SNR65624.1 SPW repeat-containing protein [Tistlia consotensis]
MKKHRWQEWVNLVLGLWVVVSPWAVAQAIASAEGVGAAAMWDDYLVGIAVALLAAAALVAFQPWEDWLNLALGCWLLVSPWVLGFSSSAALMWNAVVVGALIVVFAGWALAEEPAKKQATE